MLRIKNDLISARKLVPILLFWTATGLTLKFLPPNSTLNLILFFSCLFLSLFLLVSLVAQNRGWGLITGLFINLALLFRYFQIGTPVNLLILTAIFVGLIFILKK